MFIHFCSSKSGTCILVEITYSQINIFKLFICLIGHENSDSVSPKIRILFKTKNIFKKNFNTTVGPRCSFCMNYCNDTAPHRGGPSAETLLRSSGSPGCSDFSSSVLLDPVSHSSLGFRSGWFADQLGTGTPSDIGTSGSGAGAT